MTRLLQWKEEYSVGVALLDDQHKGLIELINRLNSTPEDTDVAVWVFEELESYTKEHFSAEERLMRKADYSHFKQHRREHRNFEQWLSAVRQSYGMGQLQPDELGGVVSEFLKNWLVEHILSSDMAYKKELGLGKSQHDSTDITSSERSRDTGSFRLEAFFPYLVRRYYRATSQTVKNVYQTRYGLSVNEWRTMAVLNDYEPLSAKEIVARSSMDKVNVSRAISSLQEAGRLERHVDPTDRRRVLLRLTAQGKKIMRELVPLVLGVEERLLQGLSAEEQGTLLRLMQKVEENADAEIRAGTSEEEGL